jgi:hypothetical protein
MDPEQIADKVIALVGPALRREMDASKQAILDRLGPMERLVVSRRYDVIEDEVLRLTRAALAEASRTLGTSTINEAVSRLLP